MDVEEDKGQERVHKLYYKRIFTAWHDFFGRVLKKTEVLVDIAKKVDFFRIIIMVS